MVRLDYQLNNNWRVHGPLHVPHQQAELPYGISGWSVRSNIDTINVISDVPGRNWMVSTTGILNNTTSLEVSVGSGHNSLITHRRATTVHAHRRRHVEPADALPLRRSRTTYFRHFSFGGGRIGNPVALSTTRRRSRTSTRPTTSSPT